ncbi:MAG: glycosyltransferase, partial [Thermoanaerobaculia bacterium]
MASLAAVVLNWNRLAATRECVAGLVGWRDPAMEVWVVDNGSDNGEAAALAGEFPAARVVAAGANLGFGGGNNLALRQAKATYALLLNNDAGIEEGDGRRLLALLEARPDLAVVGPLIT